MYVINCVAEKDYSITVYHLCASGFLDMLTRAQSSRVDDQRGLLTKEQLEIPTFLQLTTEPDQASTVGSSAAGCDENETPVTAEVAEETPTHESKDSQETAV